MGGSPVVAPRTTLPERRRRTVRSLSFFRSRDGLFVHCVLTLIGDEGAVAGQRGFGAVEQRRRLKGVVGGGGDGPVPVGLGAREAAFVAESLLVFPREPAVPGEESALSCERRSRVCKVGIVQCSGWSRSG